MTVRVQRRTLLGGALGALGLTAVAAGCGSDDTAPAAEEPRPLTSEEAELLALVRFQLYSASPVRVAMAWPGSPEISYAITLDLREHLAYGTFETREDGETDSGVAAWDLATVATAPGADGDPPPELAAWTQRAMSTQYPHDIFLALALNLGSDRPENPALLRQSTARYLRSDEVDGTRVSVLEGPQQASATASPGGEPADSGRTRYWIDKDGALLRFEAYLGQAEGEFARIDVVREGAGPATAAGDDALRARATEVLKSRTGG
ncbi:hypothetical protein KVF89_19150 [Nocardioides carbamazepini]|uniref:hypothetical protein n=1 Tax=Nocardioides carbamazepini TaxID=2854259 RepID=UPI00214A0F41|nr:hypothetical protein [Nocardioides carbamazepini]MCR1784668.1 hypothetical protein [Nocardioides carbamazepini]